MNAKNWPQLITIRLGRFLLIALLILAGAGHSLAAQEASERPLYIVVLKQGPEAPANARSLGQQYNALHHYRAVFPGFAAELNSAAVAALTRNPRVGFIEEAHTVTAYAESYPSGVDRIDADLAHPLGAIAQGTGARVAIVDTGIDFNHEDLAGQVDASLSATFVSRGKTTTGGFDDQGHGTHVAGTVAAILNNGKGVVGVAPRAKLISLKVLNRNGSGSSADIIAALDFITSYNINVAGSYNEMIHVANFSIGGSGSDRDSAYRRAFQAAVNSGCFIVVAAGNESDDAANHVPAAYDAVFTVSAMNPLTDAFASFSNFGVDVDITAPGVNTLSTLLGGGYGSKSGTSMATPHVVGAAALYVGQHLTSLTAGTAVAELRAALLNSAEALVMAGDSDGIAEPLVDAQAVLGPNAPPDPALHLTVTTSQTSYALSDSQALLTATVVDENGLPVTGLVATAFDLGPFTWTFGGENSAGSYPLTLDIGAFPLGDTQLTVTVSSVPLSASSTVTIRKANPATIFVSAIDHELVFKNLKIYLKVKDTAGGSVAAATVDITVTGSSGTRNLSKSTDAAGLADFRWAKAPSGSYTVAIVSVLKDGSTYAPAMDNLDGAVFTIP